ncbi:MAG TPA: type II toxin-antitoxin system VapC family toxin [Gemmataceae bacterium]|nr:type II toxin-antitoxin system VapC family toxin [Gemmataceae bacterium]
MSHLLDTNSLIDHLRRGPASKVTARLATAPSGSVYFCSVVLAELVYGALRSGAAHQAANLALIAGLRQLFVSLPFDDRAAEEYGKVRAHLAALGTPIGPNDLMIAAIALASRMTLVTHNTAEFSRVPDLTLEDWQ